MKVRLFIYPLLLILFCAFLYKFKLSFDLKELKDYLVFISSVSGMIFTIMGIWVAFVYPNALKRLMVSEKLKIADFSQSKLESRRLESIVASIISSLLIVLISMLIIFFSLFGFNLSRGVEIFLLVLTYFLTLIQFDSIFNVVLSNVMFINDIYDVRKNRVAEDDY